MEAGVISGGSRIKADNRPLRRGAPRPPKRREKIMGKEFTHEPEDPVFKCTKCGEIKPLTELAATFGWVCRDCSPNETS